jgi:predicted nucleic acid-binding protein
MRAAIDTSILVYAEGANGAEMRSRAISILERIPKGSMIIPVQALGELYNVLVRKAKRPPKRAQAAVQGWRDAGSIAETSKEVLLGATDLAAAHGLSIWDSVVICAAAAKGCRLLLSEDMQAGFTWRGVTVVNPFAPERSPLLAALLTERSN